MSTWADTQYTICVWWNENCEVTDLVSWLHSMLLGFGIGPGRNTVQTLQQMDKLRILRAGHAAGNATKRLKRMRERKFFG